MWLCSAIYSDDSKVYLVREKCASGRYWAMKSYDKAALIQKRQAHYIVTERNVLVACAGGDNGQEDQSQSQHIASNMASNIDIDIDSRAFPPSSSSSSVSVAEIASNNSSSDECSSPHSPAPFIVGLWYAFETASRLCLVMDFCSGGDLLSLLTKLSSFSESQARFYIAEIILGRYV